MGMDRNTVFVKTRQGEEAVRQRTKLVQRNLRSLLIMVDGRTTVEELSRRFGDVNAAQAALAELQAGGFIADVAELATAPAPAQPGTTAAEEVPVLTSALPAAEAALGPEAVGAAATEMPLLEYESVAPPLQPTAPAAAAPAGEGWLARLRRGLAAGRRKAAGRAGALPAPAAQGTTDDSDERALTVRPRPVIGWGRLVALLAGATAVLAALTFLFYPYGRHAAEIEHHASLMFRDKVKVGTVGFSLLPTPRFVVTDLAVGEGEPYLRIARLQALPDLLSLAGERTRLRELRLEGVSVRDAGLASLARAAAATPALEVRHTVIGTLALVAAGVRLDGFGGELRTAAGGGVEAVELTNAEATLALRLRPQEGGYHLTATAQGWKPPFAPALNVPWLEAEGQLRSGGLTLERIEARVADGLLAGRAELMWGSDARFGAELELKHVDAAKLLAALGAQPGVEGQTDAHLRLAARADAPPRLAERLQVSGRFEFGRGVVKGFDLAEAARTRGPVRGGETRFERLSGSLGCDGGDCLLDGLSLISGRMSATGRVEIPGEGPLKGALGVELKGSAATVRVPLAVTGTVRDPVLTPARGR